MIRVVVLAAMLLSASLVTAVTRGDIGWGKAPDRGWTWDEAWEASTGFVYGPQSRVSLGYTAGAHWFRFDWSRADETPSFLLVPQTQLDHLAVRFRDASGWTTPVWNLGDRDARDHRLPRSNFPAAPWGTGLHGSVLARVESTNSVGFEPLIFDADGLQVQTLGTVAASFVIFGFLLLMVLFNLFMIFLTRDRLYFWYSLYLVAMADFLFLYCGLLRGLWPELAVNQNLWDVPAGIVLIAAGLAFSYQANGFGDWKISPYVAATVGVGLAIAAGFQGWGDHRSALRWTNGTLLATALLIEVGAVVLAIRGRRLSRFFVPAWTVLLLSSEGIALSALNIGGAGSEVVEAFVWLMVAVLFENAVLAAALADRFRQIQKAAERQREKTALDDRLSTVGLLAARLGHEVNTSNHVVLLNTSLLDGLRKSLVQRAVQAREDQVPPGPEWDQTLGEVGDRIRSIRQAAAQVGQVVAELTPRAMTTPPEVCNLAAVVQNTFRLHEIRWREAAPRIQAAAGPETPVWAVEFRLHQLVVNLVNNAIQALSARDQAVVLAVRRDGREAVLEVTDEGRGMDEATLTQLGTAFFTTKEDRGGTGLGWGICQEIVREHRGTLAVDSRPHQGTRVTVRFALHGQVR